MINATYTEPGLNATISAIARLELECIRLLRAISKTHFNNVTHMSKEHKRYSVMQFTFPTTEYSIMCLNLYNVAGNIY